MSSHIDPNLTKETIKFVSLDKLDYRFQDPPLLVSGVAMMYHGLRRSDKDIDMILTARDHAALSKELLEHGRILDDDHKSGYKQTPEFTDLYDDHGILIYEFELWDSIMLFDYDDLKEGAITQDNYLVISLEKLLVLSVVRASVSERYLEDAKLIGKYLSEQKYAQLNHVKNKYWHELSGIVVNNI